MHNSAPKMPGRYAMEIRLIQEYNWTWQDIRNAPNDLIDELMAHLHYREHWKRERQRVDDQKAKMRARRG